MSTDDKGKPTDTPPAPTGGADEKKYTQADMDAYASGLKAKNDELLSEKKTAVQKAKEAEEKRLLAEQEAAKAAGNHEEHMRLVRAEYDGKISEMTASVEKVFNREIATKKEAILNGLAALLISPEDVELVSQYVRVRQEGDELKTEFVDGAGKLITTDLTEFKKWMGKHQGIAKLMKADAATGGGATGGGKSHNGVVRNSDDIVNNWADRFRAKHK